MPISFTCGQCSKPYVVSDGLAGKKAICKQCGNRMIVPGEAVAVAQAEAPAARPVAPRPASSSPRATSVATPVSRPKPVPSNQPAIDDLYGFNEAPSALPPVMPRIGSGADNESGDGSPVKKKKKKKGFFSLNAPKPAASKSSGSSLNPRLLWIFAVIAIGIGGFLWSRFELDSWLKHHFDLQDQLVAQLKTVNSDASARAASPKILDIFQKMSENLETNGRKKYSKTMVESMARDYQARREGLERDILQQLQRIAMIPGALQALNIEGSLQRLASVEQQLTQEAQAQGMNIR